MTGYQSKKAAARDKLAQPAQEPELLRDAWLAGAERDRKTYALSKTLTQDIDAPLTLNGVALWPKRPWVGLTEEEHIQIAIEFGCIGADWVFYAAAVERALKNKNI
jgi:hypothetical protein